MLCVCYKCKHNVHVYPLYLLIKDKTTKIFRIREKNNLISDILSQRVMYLRELRLAQMERMIAEFIYLLLGLPVLSQY